MASGNSHSSWRVEDLLDLERCGLAAELASTNLGPDGSGNGWEQGVHPEPDLTYNMSEVLDNLDNLLDDKNELPLLYDHTSHLSTPSHLSNSLYEPVEVILKSPTAHGIKTDQESVTYLNRGHSYEIELQHSLTCPVLLKSTFSLSFCELRWRNGEKDHFEQWSRDHPCDRLLEIDSIGCDNLTSVSNDDHSLHCVRFSWGQSKMAVLAIKLNCLSTEFALKKHGGEKGVPLRLVLEIDQYDTAEVGTEKRVYQGACVVKVFKDKGGDRKQRQDQLKVEKLSPNEKIKFHESKEITCFTPLPFHQDPNTSTCSTPFSSKSDSSLTQGTSPFNLTTPPQPFVSPSHFTTPLVSVSTCTSVEETRKWLLLNRFGQYSSLFSNYTGTDLLRLSRKDLMDLCGHADGIRLFNSLRTRTLKILYVRLMQEDKVHQAVCLEELSANTLLLRLLEKLGGWLSVNEVRSFVRLTASGVLVRVDDAVVHSMQEEANFLLQTIKEEDGSYQVVLQDHTPMDYELALSLPGSTPRH